MTPTKKRTKKQGFACLLTCTGNDAVPYFKKQGFSKKITLAFDRWQRHAKDYDGVTLMECIMHQEVNCIIIPMLLEAQKMALVEELNERSS